MLKINDKITIPEREIQLNYVRSSGPGGQNVNKVSSKAVLKWDIEQSSALPDDIRQRFMKRYGKRVNSDGSIQISSDRFRDRAKNVQDCEQRLIAMILSVVTPPKPRKPTKPSKASVERRIQSKKALGEKKKRYDCF